MNTPARLQLALGSILISGVVVFVLYLYFTGIFDTEQTVNFEDLPFPGPILAFWAMLGGLGIWIWMLSVHFRLGTARFRVLWGWLLLFGTFATASIYFFAVYVRQLREFSKRRK